MSENLISKSTITIQSGPKAVWDALTNPEKIKQYMFGANVDSSWRVASPITWSGEFEGQNYQDKGVVTAFMPYQKLAYTHFSARSGMPDKPDNYHHVMIKIEDLNGSLRLTLTQDNNASEKAKQQSQHNWAAMLAGLKKLVESAARP